MWCIWRWIKIFFNLGRIKIRYILSRIKKNDISANSKHTYNISIAVHTKYNILIATNHKYGISMHTDNENDIYLLQIVY